MGQALKHDDIRTLSREEQCAQLRTCRPSTAILFNMCIMGIEPAHSHESSQDFGIATKEHFKALYWCIEKGYLGPEDLDRGWRRGPILTELTQQFFEQPHMVVFKTSWDTQMEIEALRENREIEWTSVKTPSLDTECKTREAAGNRSGVSSRDRWHK